MSTPAAGNHGTHDTAPRGGPRRGGTVSDEKEPAQEKGLPEAPPGVREQRGVRVTENAGHGDVCGERSKIGTGDEGAGGRHHGRQGLDRHPEQVEQPRVPLPRGDVEQLGAGRVARLDQVLAAQAPEQPGVDGAQT